MRAIELKTVVLNTYYKTLMDGVAREVPEGTEYDPETMVQRTFDYRPNIKGILSLPPQGDDPRVQPVANIDDIRKSVAILTELKKTEEGSLLVLEDEDFNYLVSRIKGARWPFIDEVILTFIDDIEHTTAMSKERIAQAVASAQDKDKGAVRLSDTVTEAAAADKTHPPLSIIDAKRSSNGKQKEHAKR